MSFPSLIHIGSLNPGDKRGFSHEWQGLSVSLHPDAWEQIARLAGPRWELSVPGNRFVDFHALDDAARDRIVAWGVERAIETWLAAAEPAAQ